MNKQAEYIANNYKTKSVNWIMHKTLHITGGKNPKIKQMKYPKHVLSTQ